MLKKIGDSGILHISRFYNNNIFSFQAGFGLKDLLEDHLSIKEGNGLRFDNNYELDKFLIKHPSIKFNPDGMFMLIDVYCTSDKILLIVEYDGYAYSIQAEQLHFMALYDRESCEFHKRISTYNISKMES